MSEVSVVSLRMRPVWAVAFILPLAACSDEPSGPEPVAEVEVTAAATTLMVGETTQLSVTLRDAGGNVLTGRPVTYESSNQSVATVSSAGVVTAVSTGTASVSATSEGSSASVQITVQAATAPAVSEIAPATLRPGEPATITGENFSPSPSANFVTIGGELATVTAATTTSLTITVPANLCVAPGNAPVVVRVGSQSSAPVQHAVEVGGEPFTPPTGRMVLLQSTADLCLRFPATGANEAYAIGVQSAASSAGTLTEVAVAGSAAGSGGGAVAPFPSLRPPSGLAAGVMRDLLMSPNARRWAAHRAAEQRIRAADRMLLPLARALAAERRGLPGALQAARAGSIPADVAVGDTVPIRVPDLDNVCSQFTEIRTVVRVIGERGVWLDDVGNPTGGFDLNDFEQLSQRFDDQIYETNVDWFGEPTDFDANERIVIVATKEVNRQGDSPPLGFVTSADLFPRTTCATSDFGEIYYGRSADPAGEFGPVYPDSTARQDAVQLIAHEFTHIIQFGRRIENPQAAGFQTAWELEGQATLAEEVNGHVATGRTEGQNYGYDVAWTGFLDNAIPSPFPWYADAFFDMIIYFGLNFDGNEFFRTQGAPERCSWLGRESEGNAGPCLRGREVYGVSWSFLRYLTDHYAASAGGGPAFHRRLIDGNASGFINVSQTLGVDISEVLAQWSASLWLDDRFTGMDPILTFPSWNLVQIVDEGLIEEAHLQPRMRGFTSFDDAVGVRGGSTAYYTLSGGNRPATYVRFRGADGGALPAHMQVWVVRTR